MDRGRDLYRRSARESERRHLRSQVVDSKPESRDQLRTGRPLAAHRPCTPPTPTPTPSPTPTPAPTPTPTPLPIGSRKTIAYFAQWGIYGRNFKVKNLDTTGMASKLTHINYAFGNINEQGDASWPTS